MKHQLYFQFNFMNGIGICTISRYTLDSFLFKLLHSFPCPYNNNFYIRMIYQNMCAFNNEDLLWQKQLFVARRKKIGQKVGTILDLSTSKNLFWQPYTWLESLRVQSEKFVYYCSISIYLNLFILETGDHETYQLIQKRRRNWEHLLRVE